MSGFNTVPGNITGSFLTELACKIKKTNALLTKQNTVASGTATIGNITSSTSGIVAAGKQSVTFVGISGTGMLVNDLVINAGESRTWEAYLDPVSSTYNRLPAISYNGTGGVLRIITMD